MKALKVSDQTHAELTGIVGQLTAQTGKIQTYEEAIQTLLQRRSSLPPELLREIEHFIEDNRQLGYTTREEFIKDAARSRIDYLRKQEQLEGRKTAK